MVLGDEPRMFYLDRDFFLGNHAAIFSDQELASPTSFRGALARWGVTYLLLDDRTRQNVDAHRGSMETRIAELIATHDVVLVRQFGPMSLWELAPARK